MTSVNKFFDNIVNPIKQQKEYYEYKKQKQTMLTKRKEEIIKEIEERTKELTKELKNIEMELKILLE